MKRFSVVAAFLLFQTADAFAADYTFWLANRTNELVRLTLTKTGGKWDQFSYDRDASNRIIQLRAERPSPNPPYLPTDYYCKDCQQVAIKAINDRSIEVPVSVSGPYFEVRKQDGQLHVIKVDPGEAPIGYELKRIYVVNAQDRDISFALETIGAPLQQLKLPARTGTTYRCETCEYFVGIIGTTSGAPVRRRLDFGNGFLLVWDAQNSRYDFRKRAD
jgi:hypothetical protein